MQLILAIPSEIMIQYKGRKKTRVWLLLKVPEFKWNGSQKRIKAHGRKNQMEETNMSVISMKQLLEAGVHFGHQTRRWNPKMDEYIYTERNGIYIIDLQKTVVMVETACEFLRSVAEEGKEILFINMP